MQKIIFRCLLKNKIFFNFIPGFRSLNKYLFWGIHEALIGSSPNTHTHKTEDGMHYEHNLMNLYPAINFR